MTTDPNILESLLIDSLSWRRRRPQRTGKAARAHREGRRPGGEIETDGRTRAAAVAKKVVFPHLMPAGSPALQQWQMGHRPTKEGPESERLLSASSRVKRLSHGAAAAFYHFLLARRYSPASGEPNPGKFVKLASDWLAGWKGSEKFLAKSGRVDEGEREEGGN